MINEIPFTKRPLAITDLEMTGLDADVHEIIEIGLVVVNQETMEITDELDIKVKPEHIETADPGALAINGYRAEDWTNAVSLTEAIQQFADKTHNAAFSAYNVTFDWAFLERAFKKTNVKNTMDYHRIDIPSIAWALLRNKNVNQIKLSALCRYFGIPEEPKVHRGINGARLGYEVLKKLLTLDG